MSDSIKIVETPQFVSDAKKYLTEVQITALRHLLASDPATGIPLESHPEILSLEWLPDLNILYVVSQNLTEIFLVGITEIGPDDPDGFKSERISESLNTLKKVGIGVGIKELVEYIFGLFK